jgi:hypothetical protein
MNSSPPADEQPEIGKNSSDDDSTKKNYSIFQEWLGQKSNNLFIFDQFSSHISTIHRGHVLLASSLALGVLAYRDYNRPLDDVIQKALSRKSIKQQHGNNSEALKNFNHHFAPSSLVNFSTAESTAAAATANGGAVVDDALRRVIGSITAVRALRVASVATVSAFAFTGAMSLYATGCTTFQELFVVTRTWAYTKRQQVDAMLGVDQRIHRDQHPDIAAIQGMSEAQELDYVYKTYFPQDELVDPSDGEQQSK